MEDQEELLKEFHKAKREGQKLSLALRALHLASESETRQDWQESREDRPRQDPCQGTEACQELLKYLNYRRRSAVMELIRTGDLAGLKAMGDRDWLEKQYLPEYREEARRQNEPEIWAWFYRREYATPSPDPSPSRAAISASAPAAAHRSASVPAAAPRSASASAAAPRSASASAAAPRSFSAQTTAAPRSFGAQTAVHRARLGRQVWQLTVRKLRLRLPGLSEALSVLRFAPKDGIAFLAGEDFTVWYGEQELLEVYRRAPDQVSRGLMHLLLHNIYLHPLRSQGKEVRKWNLACDLAVERLLDGGAVSEAIPERPGKDYRDFLLKEYHLQLPSGDAEGIYRLLLAENPGEAILEKLEEAYGVDDHSLWQEMWLTGSSQQEEDSRQPGSSCSGEMPPDSRGQGMEGASRGDEGGQEGASDQSRFLSFWSRISREWSPQRDSQHQKAGLTAGKDSQEVRLRKKEGYDYRRFLEKFMVCQEEVELDLDSFDYLPYWYSRTHYPDIVLLEPLEYKEVHKLDEMVIAIDTSASCSGRVVRRFLEETYQILTARGNFFSKMHVHIIQCDSMIQEHVVLHSREEFLDYMEKVTVKGLGGTDFRPVFTLVDQMIENREIRDLKGLLYFTDGDGVYPTVPPAYETAFIFLNRAYEKHEVPEWGIRLNLGLRMEDI